MKKYFAFGFFLCVFLWQASGHCLAQTPNEGYITAPDGVRLFYKIVGRGKETLVAVHGGPANSLTSILPDLEPLAKNRRAIYYDQRGGGRSDLTTDGAKLSITKHVEDLEAIRQFFKLDKMTLLGNSWGGLLIGYYAAAHSDRVERLVFHNPAPPTNALRIEMEEELGRRLRRMYNKDQVKRLEVGLDKNYWLKASDPRVVCREVYQAVLAAYVYKAEIMKQLKGDLCPGSEESVRNQRLVNSLIWESLGNYNLLLSLNVVKTPALVIHGAADVIPVKASEAWASGMPDARLLLIEKAGHIPQIEQPEIFFKAVETFLKGDFPPDAKKIQTPTEKSWKINAPKNTSADAQNTKNASAPDFRLTNGQNARNIPFELYMNLIFLQVRVNDSKTLWFNLDTGLETTVFDSKQAEALGLKLEDKTPVKVPGGTIELAFANGVSFGLPGVEMSNQRVQTLPLEIFTPVLGRPIHGTIGHDLFNRFVVEIDYAKRIINLYEPKDYRYSGKGEIVPVSIETDEPFLQAEFIQPNREPIEAKLKIDTGSVNELGLNGSFVQAVKLVSPTQKVVPQPGVGLGGITENYVTRAGDLQIGRLLIKSPVVGYSKDLTRGGDAGTIGGKIFRRFKIIFDYSRRRIILEKNKHFNEPYKYDASGLFLTAEGANFETLKVLRVSENTPASEAGLRDGDVIATINGILTKKFSLEQIRQMFTQSGKTFRLTVKREGNTIKTQIKLRDLI